MKRRHFLPVLGMAMAMPGLAGAKSIAMSSTLKTKLNYLLFKPKTYRNKGEGEGVPLIVFLHGSGERGTDLRKVKAWGPPALVEQNPDFPFMVVSPQLAEGEAWHALALKAMLDEVLATHNVDRSRVYLTGLSLGGYGAWDFASRYPQYFAAVAPICGGGIARAVGAMREVPTWAFHSKRDEAVPEIESARMVEALKEAGGNVRYTVFEDAGHVDTWVRAYSKFGLFEWFLQQRRRS